jgi:predicted metal-binding membrane protein
MEAKASALRAITGWDRIVLWSILSVVIALAWLYLLWMPMAPQDLGGWAARLLGAVAPDTAEAIMMLLMWTVMMVAMMLPSAAPMIETYARVASGRGSGSGLRVGLFASGYVAIWTGFSAIATAAQMVLQRAGLVSGALVATPLVSAVLLITAGLYQVTSLKNACLSKCRAPLGFLMTAWREGASGAFLMGLHHGATCVGCCSMLMLLLFVFGVMNLIWVAVLTILVVLEKLLPAGSLIARVSGYAMLAGSIALLLY